VASDELTAKYQGLFDHLRGRVAEDPNCFARECFWKLEEGFEWLVDVNDLQTVYIRDAYRPLFDEVLRRFALFNGTSVGTAIVGNPGTGKSCFLIYCLVMFLFPPPEATYEPRSVFFWISRAQLGFYFDATFGTVKKFKNSFDLVPGLSTAKTVCLYDGARRFESQLPIPPFARLSIAALSPSRNNNDQWVRESAVPAYMAPWNFDELCGLGTRLGIDETALRRRHLFFGGIARYVLQKDPKKVLDYWKEIMGAVKDPTKVSLDAAGKYDSDSFRSMTHSVFAMIPSSDLASVAAVDFISPKIQYLYVRELQTRRENALSKFLSDYQSSNDMATVWGKVFECYAHEHLIRGDRVEVGWFEDSKNTTAAAFKSQRFDHKIRFRTLDDVCNAAHAHPSDDIYFIPFAKNFAGLDAIARSHGQWFGFQMTKNKDHPVIKARIDDLRHLLLHHGLVYDTQFSFPIYWVVPQHLFQHYPSQKLKAADGSEFVRRPSINVHPCGKIGLQHDGSLQDAEWQLVGDPGSPLDEPTDTDDLFYAFSSSP